MKIEVTDPAAIRKLLAAKDKGSMQVDRDTPAKTTRDTADTDTLTFVATSLSDLHAIARYFDFEVPGRGRFPVRRLESIVENNGHVLNVDHDSKVSTISAVYRVSLLELNGSDVIPRDGVVSGDQIRQITGGVRTGQPSRQAVADAAIQSHGWGETYLTDSLNVVKLAD